MSTPGNLRVTLVQPEIRWEDPESNRTQLGHQLQVLAGHTDLVVLPEMFTTGFSMRPAALWEGMDGPTMEWMRAQAAHLDAVVTGSFIAQQAGQYFNRLVWMRPDGTWDHYDKRHLFRMGEENDHYHAGQERLITTWKGWDICPLICYDLRFPVWSRNRPWASSSGPTSAYDLLIYVASWPAVRRDVWQTLLRARALENQCFVVGVNRVGVDGNGVAHAGDSIALDAKAVALSDLPEQEPGLQTVALSLEDLRRFRKKFPVGLDGDNFSLRP